VQRIWVGSAAMQGPEHYRRRTNRQDQVFWLRYNSWIVGAIADGCSSSPMSEVGAGILVHTAVQQLVLLLSRRTPISEIPAAYDQGLRDSLHHHVSAYPLGAKLQCALVRDRNVDLGDVHNLLAYTQVAQTLSATVLALCVHEEHGGIALISGDGSLLIDDNLQIFDYKNVPPYMSYMFAVSGQQYDGDPANLAIKTHVIPAGFSRVAITSDGWPWELGEEALPFGKWRPRAFERWLTDVNSRRSEEGHGMLTPEEGWLRYHPEEVENLTRKLVKQAATMSEDEEPFKDDLSGIFLEREVIQQ
jgi:hypothetical protein